MRQNKSGAKVKKGFLLIEAVLSLFFIMLGVLTFTAALVLANKIALQAKIRATAYNFAKSQMEYVRVLSVTNRAYVAETPIAVPSSMLANLPGGTNKVSQMQASFTVQRTTSPSLRQVTVRVTWRNEATENLAAPKPWSEVRLTTLLADQPEN